MPTSRSMGFDAVHQDTDRRVASDEPLFRQMQRARHEPDLERTFIVIVVDVERPVRVDPLGRSTCPPAQAFDRANRRLPSRGYIFVRDP